MPSIVLMFFTTLLLTQMVLTASTSIRENGWKNTFKTYFTRDYSIVAFDSGLIVTLIAFNIVGIAMHV